MLNLIVQTPVGSQFGMWTVKGPLSYINHRPVIVCQCSCGQERAVNWWHLRAGRSQSCGCVWKDIPRQLFSTHGEGSTKHRTAEYYSWRNMRARCLNPNNHAWKDYGGRGISICSQWCSYPQFLADMGRAPSPSHSIDRINPDGNYEPSNCRWATPKEQANNKRQGLKP